MAKRGTISQFGLHDFYEGSGSAHESEDSKSTGSSPSSFAGASHKGAVVVSELEVDSNAAAENLSPSPPSSSSRENASERRIFDTSEPGSDDEGEAAAIGGSDVVSSQRPNSTPVFFNTVNPLTSLRYNSAQSPAGASSSSRPASTNHLSPHAHLSPFRPTSSGSKTSPNSTYAGPIVARAPGLGEGATNRVSHFIPTDRVSSSDSSGSTTRISLNALGARLNPNSSSSSGSAAQVPRGAARSNAVANEIANLAGSVGIDDIPEEMNSKTRTTSNDASSSASTRTSSGSLSALSQSGRANGSAARPALALSVDADDVASVSSNISSRNSSSSSSDDEDVYVNEEDIGASSDSSDDEVEYDFAAVPAASSANGVALGKLTGSINGTMANRLRAAGKSASIYVLPGSTASPGPDGQQQPPIQIVVSKSGARNVVPERIRRLIEQASGEWRDDPHHIGEWATKLHTAAEYGDVAYLSEAISHLSLECLNKVDSDRQTALHKAAEYDYAECVDILIHFGAKITVQDKWGLTPLHTAAKNGSLECMRLLLEEGLSLERLPEWAEEAADASHRRSRSLLGRLLCLGSSNTRPAGMYMNTTDYKGETALHKAAKWGRAGAFVEGVQVLLNVEKKRGLGKQDMSLNKRNYDGNTPCHLAAFQNRKGLLELLIHHYDARFKNGTLNEEDRKIRLRVFLVGMTLLLASIALYFGSYAYNPSVYIETRTDNCQVFYSDARGHGLVLQSNILLFLGVFAFMVSQWFVVQQLIPALHFFGHYCHYRLRRLYNARCPKGRFFNKKFNAENILSGNRATSSIGRRRNTAGTADGGNNYDNTVDGNCTGNSTNSSVVRQGSVYANTSVNANSTASVSASEGEGGHSYRTGRNGANNSLSNGASVNINTTALAERRGSTLPPVRVTAKLSRARRNTALLHADIGTDWGAAGTHELPANANANTNATATATANSSTASPLHAHMNDLSANTNTNTNRRPTMLSRVSLALGLANTNTITGNANTIAGNARPSPSPSAEESPNEWQDSNVFTKLYILYFDQDKTILHTWRIQKYESLVMVKPSCQQWQFCLSAQYLFLYLQIGWSIFALAGAIRRDQYSYTDANTHAVSLSHWQRCDQYSYTDANTHAVSLSHWQRYVVFYGYLINSPLLSTVFSLFKMAVFERRWEQFYHAHRNLRPRGIGHLWLLFVLTPALALIPPTVTHILPASVLFPWLLLLLLVIYYFLLRVHQVLYPKDFKTLSVEIASLQLFRYFYWFLLEIFARFVFVLLIQELYDASSILYTHANSNGNGNYGYGYSPNFSANPDATSNANAYSASGNAQANTFLSRYLYSIHHTWDLRSQTFCYGCSFLHRAEDWGQILVGGAVVVNY